MQMEGSNAALSEQTTMTVPLSNAAPVTPPPLNITISQSKKSSKPSNTGLGTNESLTEDIRANRRIIAEDNDFNREKVKSLVELALIHIIDNFAFNYSALPFLGWEQRRLVLDKISPDMPLKVTANLIPEDPYWKRCCLHHWPVVDVVKHGNNWKRAYFEKKIEDMIQMYIPGQTYPVWIAEALVFAAPYVKRLDIKEMLPPVKKGPKLKKNSEEDEDDSETESTSDANKQSIQADHLDLGFVVEKLEHLHHLGVQYRVKKCGLNFEWTQFQFTGSDCLSFARAIKSHINLTILELTQSRVDCERCRVLVGYLLDHPTLKVLNLSHNIISDWGARALAKLLNDRSKLECLNLSDNRFTAEGAEALSHALMKGAKYLRKLNLRLNRLKDEGGCVIAKALLKNESLKELNLSANNIGDSAVLIFGKVLTHNTTLTRLDLSNNQIGVEAGRKLQECVAANMTLTYIDLRFTGCPQVSEFAMQHTVEDNDNRLRTETEKSESGTVKLPGIISVAVEEVIPVFEKVRVRQSFFTASHT